VTWALFILGSYVIGSVPFGVLIGRMRGVDIRTQGSRNIGATNVGRLLGRPWGITCFGLDFLKGAVPVLAAGWHFVLLGRSPAELGGVQMWLWLAVATATVLGHMASIFLRFAGGKGVATSFGAIVAMWSLLTLPAVGALAVWYVTLRITRYMSLASMLAAVSLPLWYLVRLIVPAGDRSVGEVITHGAPPLIVTALLAALVVWRHRANIGRLRRGEETRVGGG
jgi:glycerol-3-phosphate acyltransferase PlsY